MPLRVVELLSRLVAFDTTSERTNLPLVEALADLLDRPGVRIQRQPHPSQPKANLIVEIGPPTDAASRAGLVLSGHMDVVPAAEPGWESDPFTLTERDGFLYGRGSADMKGFLAIAVAAAASLDPERLRHPLVLLLTYDEELGTLGARHFHHSWPADHPLPRMAVIGEPTELQVVSAHKGHLKARLTIAGETAHSAYPHLGHNAIEPAGRLLLALVRLRERFAEERWPSSARFPEVPWPSLNIARIDGGRALNVVPDRCVVEVGIRLLPGMAGSDVGDRLREAAAEALDGERWELEILSESPPMELADDAPLRGLLAELTGGALGEAASFATDAGWLQRRGMDCVLYGPGSIRVAHKPNEFVPRRDLEVAAEVVEALIERVCGSAA